MDQKKNKRNKIILLLMGIGFLIFVLWTTYDIMRRTTRPGARKHLPHQILR